MESHENPLFEEPEQEVHVHCPVCHVVIAEEDFHHHILERHSTMFAIMVSSLYPHLSQEEVFEALEAHTTFEVAAASDPADDPEDMTYEELLDLCERVGNHYVGVRAVDEAAPCVPREDLPEGAPDLCTICLERFEQDPPLSVRRIHACGHCFCAPCIERWFEEHRTCPICKTEVEAPPESWEDEGIPHVEEEGVDTAFVTATVVLHRLEHPDEPLPLAAQMASISRSDSESDAEPDSVWEPERERSPRESSRGTS